MYIVVQVHAVCHTVPWYRWYIRITGHTVPPNYSEKLSHRKPTRKVHLALNGCVNARNSWTALWANTVPFLSQLSLFSHSVMSNTL